MKLLQHRWKIYTAQYKISISKSVLSACIQTGELHQPSSLKNSILATHPKDCLGAGTVYEVAQYILRNSSITDCHLSSRTAERTFKKRHLMVAIFNHLLYWALLNTGWAEALSLYLEWVPSLCTTNNVLLRILNFLAAFKVTGFFLPMELNFPAVLRPSKGQRPLRLPMVLGKLY